MLETFPAEGSELGREGRQLFCPSRSSEIQDHGRWSLATLSLTGGHLWGFAIPDLGDKQLSETSLLPGPGDRCSGAAGSCSSTSSGCEVGRAPPGASGLALPRSGLRLGSPRILTLKELPPNPLRSSCPPPHSGSVSILPTILRFSCSHLLISFLSLFSNSFRLPLAAPSLFLSLGLPGSLTAAEIGEHVAPEWLALPPLLGDLRQRPEESRNASALHFALAQPWARLFPFYWALLFYPSHFFTWLPYSSFLSV